MVLTEVNRSDGKEIKSPEKALWGRWAWSWNLKDGLSGFPRKK